jgi:hypothetical protein
MKLIWTPQTGHAGSVMTLHVLPNSDVKGLAETGERVFKGESLLSDPRTLRGLSSDGGSAGTGDLDVATSAFVSDNVIAVDREIRGRNYVGAIKDLYVANYRTHVRRSLRCQWMNPAGAFTVVNRTTASLWTIA